MADDLLLGLASIIILGIGAEWLAWRIRLPSILLLLIFGFIAGSVTGFLKPDEMFGDLLLPIVSLAVAIILFEGGLNLKISELRRIGSVVRNLVTIGALVTWLIGGTAAFFLLNLELPLAILLGAILVVTGPTVIVPLLRHLRPSGQVGSILKWEGIVIDPIGAVLAVLVFEVIIASSAQEATAMVITSLLKTIFAGGAIGAGGAIILILLLRSYRIPDFLHSAVTLTMVIGAFTASNLIQNESGLLAATVMGITLANQKSVSIRQISKFKENLSLILISSLFILLAARLNLDNLAQTIGLGSLGFVAVLMLIARPLSVALSTARSALSLKERLFLSWLAPRGIVAAAITSVFALRLVEAGYPQAELLVPLAFIVIAGTVAVYGLTATPVARWLGIAQPHPQGVLIIGAHTWARNIASALQAEGIKVMVADTNWASISTARMAKLPTFHGNILSQYALEEMELGGIGRMLALTSDSDFNSLAVLHFVDIFDRAQLYQLPLEGEKEGDKRTVSRHLRGRLLFGPDLTYGHLSRLFAGGATIKTTSLTEEFDYDDFQVHRASKAIPLFLISQNGNLAVFTTDNPPQPQPGQKLISIIPGAETPSSGEL